MWLHEENVLRVAELVGKLTAVNSNEPDVNKVRVDCTFE